MRVRVVPVSMSSGRLLGLGRGVGEGLAGAEVAHCAPSPVEWRSETIGAEVEAALGGGGPGRCDSVNSEMTGLGDLGAALTGGAALAYGVGDLLLRCFVWGGLVGDAC